MINCKFCPQKDIVLISTLNARIGKYSCEDCKIDYYYDNENNYAYSKVITYNKSPYVAIWYPDTPELAIFKVINPEDDMPALAIRILNGVEYITPFNIQDKIATLINFS